MTVRRVFTGREYNIHHNCYSTSISLQKFDTGTTVGAGVLRSTHENPRENFKEPEEDLYPVADSAIALQRSCHRRVLRPRRDPDFDYFSVFLNLVLPLHASTFSARDYSFALFAASLPSHANPGSSPLAIQGSAFPKLRQQLNESEELVFYVEIAPRTFRWYVMLNKSGTIMVFDDDKDTFYNPMTNTTLADLKNYAPWSRYLDKRALTDNEVHLPGSVKDLFGGKCGAHLVARNGHSEE